MEGRIDAVVRIPSIADNGRAPEYDEPTLQVDEREGEWDDHSQYHTDDVGIMDPARTLELPEAQGEGHTPEQKHRKQNSPYRDLQCSISCYDSLRKNNQVM